MTSAVLTGLAIFRFLCHILLRNGRRNFPGLIRRIVILVENQPIAGPEKTLGFRAVLAVKRTDIEADSWGV